MVSQEQLERHADVVATVGLRVAVDGSTEPLQPERERAVE